MDYEKAKISLSVKVVLLRITKVAAKLGVGLLGKHH